MKRISFKIIKITSIQNASVKYLDKMSSEIWVIIRYVQGVVCIMFINLRLCLHRLRLSDNRNTNGHWINKTVRLLHEYHYTVHIIAYLCVVWLYGMSHSKQQINDVINHIKSFGRLVLFLIDLYLFVINGYHVVSDPLSEPSSPTMLNLLTYICVTHPHWGRVTHICVGNLTIIASDNGLSPGRRQVIIWNNAGILSIGSLGINSSEILIEIRAFWLKKMHLKMSFVKWRPSCLGLDVLKINQ